MTVGQKFKGLSVVPIEPIDPNVKLVHHFLERSARLFPDKVALIHGPVRATYSEINHRADNLASHLVSIGVQTGDRVVILFNNCLEYVISYYAALKAGAVAVPLSTDLKPDGLRPLLAELAPRGIISSSKFEKILRALEPGLFQNSKLVIQNPEMSWASTGCDVHDWDDLGHDAGDQNLDIKINDSDLASIIYTSGSTGKPKGVMLSHQNVVSNTHAIIQSLEIRCNDIQMVVLPFFYVMGKSLLNTHFAAGASVVINNKFAFPATVITEMIDEKVTAFSGVPSTFAYLLHRSPLKINRDKLHHLRYCSQAGGHMSRHVKEELRAALPPAVRICIMYGATEASARLSSLDPEKFQEKMDSIGKPIQGVQFFIMNEKGEQVPIGETGEIVVAGPNIMQGYWKDEAATAEALVGNGYRTGDLGYQDQDGYYYVCGRKDNLLKVGGHRINPQEIEDALIATGLVMEAAVLGIPDALLGSKLVAVVAPASKDFTAAQILNKCAEKLPKFKLPGAVNLVRALPKNSSGKIERSECLKLIK